MKHYSVYCFYSQQNLCILANHAGLPADEVAIAAVYFLICLNYVVHTLHQVINVLGLTGNTRLLYVNTGKQLTNT